MPKIYRLRGGSCTIELVEEDDQGNVKDVLARFKGTFADENAAIKEIEQFRKAKIRDLKGKLRQ